MENIEVVLKALKESGKPLKGGELADITGIDKKSIDKAIKQLKTNGEIVSPKRCFYEAI
jgi:biotin operon repressor